MTARLLAFAIAAIAACAPAIDTPAERQAAGDRADGDRVAAMIRRLPGVASASVIVHRDADDALAPPPRLDAPPAIAIAIVLDGAADRTATTEAAQALALAAIGGADRVEPDSDSEQIVDVSILSSLPRSELARVGPFTVAADSQTALRATLIALLAALAALAAYVARRARSSYRRRGNSAQ